jgi:hypothetical protein
VVPKLGARLAQAGAAAAVAITLMAAPVEAAQLNSLADVMRDNFAFVDSNADGVVTLSELKQISAQASPRMAMHAGIALPSDRARMVPSKHARARVRHARLLCRAHVHLLWAHCLSLRMMVPRTRHHPMPRLRTIHRPQVSSEENMAQPSETQLSFTLRLFDLNQDGTLTTDEMLTSLALDAVVSRRDAHTHTHQWCMEFWA